ncbi:corrinoid methyltransferase [Melioribacter roseus P3M-2]|uniref:Corrinoid methyltransferase n=2 Tax=Melioribacter roseus TaxID=1134405 RepID=I6ZTF1_MELRP|nr:corrinoid methyltransferase [Melioribacter roseus P3M-2]
MNNYTLFLILIYNINNDGNDMDDLIKKISYCIERGKVNKSAPYPPDLKDQEGADELALKALETGVKPFEILDACNVGMKNIGEKFSRNEVFVPELLMAAKAMQAVMNHLKPYFQTGEVKKKGKFVIGTVAGDLHDIGKNLVSMVVEGNGWEVIDLGVDVKTNKFLEVISNNRNCTVGLSALLTTTMANMSNTVAEIKNNFPDIKVIVGGAPVTREAAIKMGADAYGDNPQKAVEILEQFLAG